MTGIMTSNAQSCGALTGVNQMISISDLDAGGDITISNIKQDSNVKVNFTCMQNAQTQSDLANQFQQELKNNMKQATSGYQFRPSETETVNRNINELATQVNVSNVADCMAKSFSDQTTLIQRLSAKKDIWIENLAQTAIMDATANCMQTNGNVTKLKREPKQLKMLGFRV
jgi:hypothetical protein